MQLEDLTDDAVYGVVDAVVAQGGDASQPTVIRDSQTGAAVAVVQQRADGSIAVQPASSSAVANAVQSVTGFLSDAAGFLQGLTVQIKRINNAVQGGAAGAQAGYNAPTDWMPFVVGGLVFGGVLLLSSAPRKRG